MQVVQLFEVGPLQVAHLTSHEYPYNTRTSVDEADTMCKLSSLTAIEVGALVKVFVNSRLGVAVGAKKEIWNIFKFEPRATTKELEVIRAILLLLAKVLGKVSVQRLEYVPEVSIPMQVVAVHAIR